MFRKLKSFVVEKLYSFQEGRSHLVPEFFLSNLGFEYREPDVGYSQTHINSIMTLLRRTPWWAKGHLRLGWLALGIKEFDLAFASFEAVRRLGSNETLSGNACVGLARCYLAKGRYDKAIELIKKLPEDLLSDDYIKVQLAACYMAEERFDEAQSIIEEIPETKRSPETVEVLDYLTKRAEAEKKKSRLPAGDL